MIEPKEIKRASLAQIGYDGWGRGIYRITLRDMLRQLGAIDIDGSLVFQSEDKRLDEFVNTMEDDGMGYGENERWVTDVQFNEGKPCIWVGKDEFKKLEELGKDE